jgi:chaperonin GroEL
MPSKCSKVRTDGVYGHNAGAGEYGDMMDEDTLDTANVTRLALQSAAPVADLVPTTELMLAEAPKDNDRAHGAPGSGMEEMDGTNV